MKKVMFVAPLFALAVVLWAGCDDSGSGSMNAALGSSEDVTYGTLDNTFNSGGSGFDGVVNDVLVQPDGKILVGGYFNNYNGADVPDCLVRLNADGSLDTAFNAGGSGFLFSSYPVFSTVNALALQNDGKILVGGYFDTFNGTTGPAGIMRLNADGSHDTTFNNGGSGGFIAYAIVVLDDGKILIGGGGVEYNGATVPAGIIRLTSDGLCDTTFNYVEGTPNAGAEAMVHGVKCINVLADDHILIAGDFTSYNGNTEYTQFVELKEDGTVTEDLYELYNLSSCSLLHELFPVIECMYIQSDGKPVIGGSFYEYSLGGYDLDMTPDSLCRLDADYSLDYFFNNGFSGVNGNRTVHAIAGGADGTLLIGGNIGSYNGVDVPDGIMCINSDGSIYDDFNVGGVGTDDVVSAIAVLDDGSILVGGNFTMYNNESVSCGLIRLQP